MLNINVKVDIDVSKKQYPVYFEKRNVCVHCGAEGSLTFVDKFGRETKREIYPFDHIKCKACGREYSIMWQYDSDNPDVMYPTAVDPSIKQEFFNLLGANTIRRKGEKSL